jgi:O-antigen/teichoic acid export membrane protein
MLNFLSKKLDYQSRRLFKNSSWVFFSNFTGAVLALIKSIIIARYLGADWYGIFTIIIVFTGTIQETLNLNLGAALIRFGSGFKTQGQQGKLVSLIKVCLLASTLVSLLSIGVIYIFTLTQYDSFIKAPGLAWFAILYAVAASSLFFTQISRSLLRLYYKFKYNAGVQIVMDIVDFIVICLVLILFPNRFDYFLIAVLVTKLINGFIPNIAAFREMLPEIRSQLHSGMNLIKNQYREIGGFVFQNSIAKTLQSLIKNGDILLLAFLIKEPAPVAIYTVGKKLAFSILMITDPLVTSIYPQLCDLFNEKNITAMKTMLVRLTVLMGIPSVIFIVFAFFTGDWIMDLIYGSEYKSAGKTFMLLAAAALVQASMFWIQPLLQAVGLMRTRIYVYLAGILSGLLFAWLLVPLYGTNGMAFSVIGMNLIMPMLFIYFAVVKLRTISAHS